MQWLLRVASVLFVGAFVITPRVFAGPAIAREGEPNSTPALATAILSNSTIIEGSISPAGDLDYFSFTANAGDRIFAATMTSLSPDGYDTALDVLDTDGTTVIESDDLNGAFAAGSSSVAGVPIALSGTYFLRVRYPGGAGQIIPYRLFFQKRTGAPAAEVEPNDDASPQPLPAGAYVSGSLSSASDVDRYTVMVNAGDTLFMSLDEYPSRTGAEWGGFLGIGPSPQDGYFLAVNGSDAPGPDSLALFMTMKTTGTIDVRVSASPSFGPYVLNVTTFPGVNEGVHCTSYSTTVPVSIPDVGTITSTISVPAGVTVRDLDVAIKLNHGNVNDLDATLTSPAGTIVALFSNVGIEGTGFDATFDDEAGVPFGLFGILDGFTFTPELFYRLSWFDGEPAEGNWTLTIYDDKADSRAGELREWSLRICEPVAPCNAGYSLSTVFATDFESGPSNFTHSGTADEWEFGLPSAAPIDSCNSGTDCWKTDLSGTYEGNSDQDLLSPTIDLTAISGPVYVEWAQKYQIGSAVFDSFRVEARQPGIPATAVRLFAHDGPEMQTTTVGFGGAVNEASGWGTVQRRIDAFAGNNLELRFHVDSDATTNLAGVAIDDVKVVACIPLQLPAPQNLSAAAQSAASIKLTWDPSLNATAYDIERRSSDSPTWGSLATGVTATTFNDTVLLAAGRAYVYRVKATAPSFPSSDFSKPDAATTFTFDDDPLAVDTPVRAAHVNQLRDAIAALRVAVGRPAFTWTDDPVDNTVLVKAAHIDEMRAAANDARTFIGMDAFVFATDPTITPQTTPFKPAHANELREALR